MWVDPLDGTNCYVNGDLEAVTVLIGIAYEGHPIFGVVHGPFQPEPFIYYGGIGVPLARVMDCKT